MQKNKIIYLVPVPPPFSGPEIANEMLLQTEVFAKAPITFVKSNIQKTNKKKGRFSFYGLFSFLKLYIQLTFYFINPCNKYFYFLLSSSKLGFLRDSLYVFTASLFRKKIVAHYRGSNFVDFYVNQSDYYKKLISFIVKRIHKIIVQGEVIKTNFSTLISPDKMSVVYNGIKISETKVLYKEHKCFTLLFIGHLWFPKGFYDLIKAYKILYKKYGNRIRLLFAGERTGFQVGAAEFVPKKFSDDFLKNSKKISDDIEEFIDNASNFNAEYLGFISGNSKQEILLQSDVFVLPSYTEGFSMASLEAMAVGLAVIVTRVGAFSEIITEEKNGKFVEIGNCEMLAKTIEELMLNTHLLEEIRKYNIDYVKNNFEIEKIADLLIRTIKCEKDEKQKCDRLS